MSVKRILDSDWADAAHTAGWFALIFSLWARALLAARLRAAPSRRPPRSPGTSRP
jgi:hypothetical protein